METILIALDIGTTGTRAIAFAKDKTIIASSHKIITAKHPEPSWTEYDPEDIWVATANALKEVVEQINIDNISSISITNQRETIVAWNKRTGYHLYNAISWQCKRTTKICDSLKSVQSQIKEKTGLFPDPYFSASKIKWLIDNTPYVKIQVKNGNAVFGTIDAWILWKLTNGRVFATEPSNASRTMLYNINTLKYDTDLLTLFHLNDSMLPEVKNSNDHFGSTYKDLLGKSIPIKTILGDQQAALFAEHKTNETTLKTTIGTGIFTIANTHTNILKTNKLIHTIAWQCNNNYSKKKDNLEYAIEGCSFSGTSALEWLCNELPILQSPEQSDAIAKQTKRAEDLYMVPAFSGLGAPYWNPKARGLLIGITQDTTKNQIIQATLDSLAYQTKDIIDIIQTSNIKDTIHALHVNVGGSNNDYLLQFLANLINLPIQQSHAIKKSAWGVVALTGISENIWTKKEIEDSNITEKEFNPNEQKERTNKYYKKWKTAVSRSLNWVD